MGAETVVCVGSWTCVGWVLDAQRALARADRTVARSWLFKSGVESARSALFRLNRVVLDRAPVIEHLPRVLHGSIPTASACAADSICCAAVADNSRMFCAVSSGRLGVAMDT